MERATETTEDCSVSPGMITVKKDKSVKSALDSRQLNDVTIKRKDPMPNMEELMSRKSRKMSEEKEGKIWITKLDFDYAYGQIKLDEETSSLYVFTVKGGEFTGYYRFLKGFNGLADIPTIFQERIDKTLEFIQPAWLDDIFNFDQWHSSKTRAGSERNHEEIKRCWKQFTPKLLSIFQYGRRVG